jgi:hypothetical protein
MTVHANSVIKLNHFILFAAKIIEIFVWDTFLTIIFSKTVFVYSVYNLKWQY